MTKITFRKLKTQRIKNPDSEKSIALWIYGYYACSCLCMTPSIDLTQNKDNQF